MGPGSEFGRRKRKTYLKRSWTHSLKCVCRKLYQETSAFVVARAFYRISEPEDILPQFGRMSLLQRHTLTRLHIRMSILYDVPNFKRTVTRQWGSFRNAFPNVEYVVIQHLCFCGAWDPVKVRVKFSLYILDDFLFANGTENLRVMVSPGCPFWSWYAREMADRRLRIEFDLEGDTVDTYKYWSSIGDRSWYPWQR